MVLKPIVFTLGYPPSINAYWAQTKTGRIYKTKEAKDYCKAAATLGITNGFTPFPTGMDLKMVVIAYRPRRTGDVDNIQKCLLDALNGVAYADDKQIARLTIERFEDKDNPRVEVWIEERATDAKPEQFPGPCLGGCGKEMGAFARMCTNCWSMMYLGRPSPYDDDGNLKDGYFPDVGKVSMDAKLNKDPAEKLLTLLLSSL